MKRFSYTIWHRRVAWNIQLWQDCRAALRYVDDWPDESVPMALDYIEEVLRTKNVKVRGRSCPYANHFDIERKDNRVEVSNYEGKLLVTISFDNV